MLIPRRETCIEVRHITNEYVTHGIGTRTKHTSYRYNQLNFVRESSDIADKTQVELTCSACQLKMALVIASVRRTWILKLKFAGVSVMCALLCVGLFSWANFTAGQELDLAHNLIAVLGVLAGASALGTFVVALMHSGNLGYKPMPSDHHIIIGCKKR
jgi:hypothetical protein